MNLAHDIIRSRALPSEAVNLELATLHIPLSQQTGEAIRYAEREGRINGWPGYVRQGFQTEAQVDYGLVRQPKELTGTIRNTVVLDRCTGQVLGCARWGGSATETGRQAARFGRLRAHAESFAIVRTAFNGEQRLSDAGMVLAGFALARAVAIEAQGAQFEEMTHMVELGNLQNFETMLKLLDLTRSDYLSYQNGPGGRRVLGERAMNRQEEILNLSEIARSLSFMSAHVVSA